jgi:hypothetical protein
MARNITLRIDETLLKEAKVLAASRDTSVSRLLSDLLEQYIRQHRAYDSAQRRALARLRRGYRLGIGTPPPRDMLHER